VLFKKIALGIVVLFFAVFLSLNLCEQDDFNEESNSNCTKISFWNKSRKGANIFNVHVIQSDIRAAKDYGIQFVRLAIDRFPTKRKDFLIGDADNYTSLDQEDLQFLKSVLDIFAKENMPVIITTIGLPGSRWKQLNGGKDDLRIWKDARFQNRAAKFWKDLAKELSEYKIVVGYNILNEPHPERVFNLKNIHIEKVNQEEAQKSLFVFNNLIVHEIRNVAPETPIIIDSSGYADPNTFEKLQPIDDESVIYSFHMYEPYEYTNHRYNKGKYDYPGYIAGEHWDAEKLKKYMKAVNNFQKKHNISANRIMVGEFGCYRKQNGVNQYLGDLINIFKENKWHWAFYSFREDEWDGMDYELGNKALPWEFWKAKERGEKFTLDRKITPTFNVILKAIN
jgi:hypothetical protein